MLPGEKRLAERRLGILAMEPSKPVLKMEYITMYGLASGATARTSTRELRSLPMGIRTMEPRSTAEAINWLGASKWGSRRRKALTLGLSTRQMSLPAVRTRSVKSQANWLIFSSPLGSQKMFLPPLLTLTLVC